jgi:hypothetical protein
MKELAGDLEKGTKDIVRFPRYPIRFPRLPRRFPRRGPDDLAAKAKVDRLNALTDEAFRWIARGRPANIKLGRIFNQIKDDILNHGEWKPYFTKKFLPHGIAFRTAQDYMKLANEANKITENANSALFPPPTDHQAQEINDASEKAKVAVAAAGEQSPEVPDKETNQRKKRVRLAGIYKLPLYMTGALKDATDLFLESKKWSRTERDIMDLLRRRLKKYGFLNDSEKEEKDETN